MTEALITVHKIPKKEAMNVALENIERVEVILLYNKKSLDIQGFFKLLTGIEPVTFSLPMRCATDCATAAFDHEILAYKTCFVK